MYQISSFAFNQTARSIALASVVTQDDTMCASCADDAPQMPRVIHGIPVRVCGHMCADKLVYYWRPAQIVDTLKIVLDKLFRF